MIDYKMLYEKAMVELPPDVKKKLDKRTVRDGMSRDSFLLTGEKKCFV